MPPVDKQKVSEELEQLQLEEARERIQLMRAERINREQRRAMVQQSLVDSNRNESMRQSNCLHKKGGKGVGGLYRGNDQNYAVVKHTISTTGTTIVVCIRCSKIWSPPDTKLIAKGASQKEREYYRKQYEEYMWALNLPTDNEPSGTQILRMVENFYPSPEGEVA